MMSSAADEKHIGRYKQDYRQVAGSAKRLEALVEEQQGRNEGGLAAEQWSKNITSQVTAVKQRKN